MYYNNYEDTTTSKLPHIPDTYNVRLCNLVKLYKLFTFLNVLKTGMFDDQIYGIGRTEKHKLCLPR